MIEKKKPTEEKDNKKENGKTAKSVGSKNKSGNTKKEEKAAKPEKKKLTDEEKKIRQVKKAIKKAEQAEREFDKKSRSEKTALVIIAVIAVLVAAVLLVLFRAGFFSQRRDYDGVFSDDDKILRVSFIDVGQGDSSFIEFPDGSCMLIDSGEYEMAERVIKYIKSRGVRKIDYVLVTHPHSDHMGGMAKIIGSFQIGKIYMTNAVTTTSIFENLLSVIESKGLKVTRAKEGVVIKESAGIEVTLLSPVGTGYENLNNYSSVCKISYKDRKFLFMGDAEMLAENELKGDLSCDVVKIGHHGSSTSSGDSFVRKTGAAFGILSLGEGNVYGHPHAGTVRTWQKYGTRLLRTDELGTIVFETNGSALRVSYGKSSEIYTDVPESASVDNEYVINEGEREIHLPSCPEIDSIYYGNLSYKEGNIDEIRKNGYSLCPECFSQ